VGKYHEYYDKLNTGKKDYGDEVARLRVLYHDLRQDAKLNFDRYYASIDSILEIGSGTGNHTEHLSTIARYVCACDVDPEMQKIASEKLEGRNIKFCADIADAPETKFPLCVMMWHVLNYFPSIHVVNHVFKHVSRRLEDNGFFLFDAWNGVAVIRDLPRKAKNVIEVDGQTIIHNLNSSTDLMKQRTVILNQVEVYEDEALVDSFSKAVAHHIWTPKTIVGLLEMSGFELVRIAKVDDYNETASEDDWKVMFIARKRK
jgi:SAM-dependent methyltransferase